MALSTLKAVAREAGVSYLTALRVMGSSPGQVRPATARRVREAANRLEYRPNAAARALTSQTSPYIGVLYGVGPGCSSRIPVPEMMRAYSEFHFELTSLLESRDYYVLTSGAPPHVAESSGGDSGIPKLLQQRHVGALVVVGDIWPELHREIVRFRLPAVGIYCQSVANVPTADMDYQTAARLCVNHLLELGHERIAFVPGHWKTWKTEPMQLGYLAALGAAGVKPVPCWDRFCHSADLVVEQLGTDRHPTAFVVYDDYEAVRVIERLDSEGLRVPNDVSVVAIQNLGPGAVRRPTVSGCRVPAMPMAQKAVDLLLHQLSDQGQAGESALIETSLVVADSSSTPRASSSSPPLLRQRQGL